MMRGLHRFLGVLVILSMLLAVLPASALANPPYPGDPVVTLPEPAPDQPAKAPAAKAVKPLDQPNILDYSRIRERQRLLEAAQGGQSAQADTLALTGSDRVLVILVEFAGTDVFTWTQGVSTWDPLGISDPNESTGVAGDCSKIITQTRTFTYTSPLHNQLPRPLSAADRSGDSIWTPDFTPDWYDDFMFGNGVTFNYTRADGSQVYEDFSGKSVKQYYEDASSGRYTIGGDVIGWLPLPHSTWWYGADQCPGARSLSGAGYSGAIPGAGNSKSLVRDALNAVNAISNTIPGFNWANYDQNGDGVIDRLWIVHSGYGEEDSTTLLNRTSYGESSMWSHSSSVTPYYQVAPGIKAGPYIMMPENGGIGVFAHESGHNLGVRDLYAYNGGETSAGFWTLMADDWTGYPIGFEPPMVDPYSLDEWGWLEPKIVFDPNQVYQVTLGQASSFPGGAGVYRGAKIQLPNGSAPLPVPVWQGSNYWWGGKQDLANAMMTAKNPITIPVSATLSFDLVYDIENQWDFLWVQASDDAGVTWKTITNTNTVCTHDVDWIGELYEFPGDMCAAGMGGFTNYNASWPSPETETFDLSAFAGKNVLFRLWYMTDWGTTYSGPFVDNFQVTAGMTTLFSDNAESGDANWTYALPWQRSTGTQSFSQNYYLQWRNVSDTGGYDSALADPRWRFGPANTGLLVWYNNNFYSDNEIYSYLEDWPSFGPKGRALVVDSHPDPYRDPLSQYPNAIANLTSRGQMRDAPFSLADTVPFTYSLLSPTASFAGRPAVSTFQDARGYYAGLEYALRGPAPCASTYWFDKMWDASAVVPARGFYSTKAPGAPLTTGTGIRMRGYVNPAGTCKASWYGYWYVPYADASNTGNPIDSSADYGWRVQIVSQTNQTATLKIWNTHYRGALSADKTVATSSETINYTYSVPVNDGSAMSLFACVDLDSTKVSYVADSVTNGAVPLTGPCGSTSSVAAVGPAASVQSIGWTGYIAHGATASFAFSVKPKSYNITVALQGKLFLDGVLRDTLPAQPVNIVPAYQIFLPLVFRQ